MGEQSNYIWNPVFAALIIFDKVVYCPAIEFASTEWKSGVATRVECESPESNGGASSGFGRREGSRGCFVAP